MTAQCCLCVTGCEDYRGNAAVPKGQGHNLCCPDWPEVKKKYCDQSCDRSLTDSLVETVIINLGRNELLTDENVFSRRTHMKKIISRKRFELRSGATICSFGLSVVTTRN